MRTRYSTDVFCFFSDYSKKPFFLTSDDGKKTRSIIFICWTFAFAHSYIHELKKTGLAMFSTKLYNLCVLTFMHWYFNDNLPSSFQNMFKSLAEPNRTKSYKLERVLNKNLESFPSAMFPKLWNAIKIDLDTLVCRFH